MSKFSPCRYCEETGQRFSFDEYVRVNQEPLYSEFYVVCKCGNRTSKMRQSFDGALEQWNEENEAEPKQAERICKNCVNKTSNAEDYGCHVHQKPVKATDTCNNWFGW